MRSTAFLFALAGASALSAQQPASSSAALSRDEIASLARLQIAINTAHDSANVQLAAAKNTTPQAQASLHAKLDGQIDDILHHAGLTEPEYRRKAFLVSTDPSSRKMFDSVVVVVSGAPLPGMYVAPAARPTVAVPAGPAGVHLGHVVNAFSDTPMGQGLLPTAIAEAKIAAQHAMLAGRQPTNLDYMKTHAGHVINAIDPTVVAAGPGLKYGVKKATEGVITHIELAAAAQGASPGIATYSQHIATSARNTLTRADAVLALAQKVQASTSASEAAALVSQMASLADQLVAGVDANADGKITWERGEGGLQQCEDQLRILLAGEL
jgi:hypothetical protein